MLIVALVALVAVPAVLPILMEFSAPGQARVAWRGNVHVAPGSGAKSTTGQEGWAELKSQNERFAGKLEKYRGGIEF